MGNFTNNAITDAGRRLLGDVQMGAVFTPTKIVIGSGNIPPDKTVRTITQVTTPVIELVINKKKKSNDGTFVVGGVYSNESISQDFYFRELALYAKSVKNGVASDEVLYSYGNAGDTADLMPAYSTGSPVERQIDIATYIGNDTQVDLTIEHGLFVTREQVNEIVQEALPLPSFDELADTYGFDYREIEQPDGNVKYVETVRSGSPVVAIRETTESVDSKGRDVFTETTTIDGVVTTRTAIVSDDQANVEVV